MDPWRGLDYRGLRAPLRGKGRPFLIKGCGRVPDDARQGNGLWEFADLMPSMMDFQVWLTLLSAGRQEGGGGGHWRPFFFFFTCACHFEEAGQPILALFFCLLIRHGGVQQCGNWALYVYLAAV